MATLAQENNRLHMIPTPVTDLMFPAGEISFKDSMCNIYMDILAENEIENMNVCV